MVIGILLKGSGRIYRGNWLSDGTTFIVRNIFYNTPARRNFLKSPGTEASYISDLMERILLSHPDVSFKYIVNNKLRLQSSGNSNTRDIIYQIYGRDIARSYCRWTFNQKTL